MRRPRSARAIATRGAIVVVAMLGAYVGTAQSIAGLLRTARPDLAQGLAPWDGRNTAALAQNRFAQEPITGTHAASIALARQALNKNPIAVPAIATLGYAAHLGKDLPRARRIFAFAQGLSRRDLPVQLWLIEDAVARGRIDQALQHYDIGLRTAKAAPGLLYPVLLGAIAEPAIRAGLVHTLAARPVWGPAFIRTLADSAADPVGSADLLLALHRIGTPVEAGASASLLNRLFAKDAEAAWRYYAGVRPGADRRRSRDPRFMADVDPPSLFDWLPYNADGVSTTIQPGAGGGTFSFTVPTGAGGTLLSQTQMLPPGRYQLRGHSTGIDQADSALPYWTLTCRGGMELGRIAVPNSVRNKGLFAGTFSVPAACPVQVLSLVARPSDRIGGVSGQVDMVELVPAGGDDT